MTLYDFVLYTRTEPVDTLLARVREFGVQVVSTYNEGESVVVRGVFPSGKLRRFQSTFPCGWFKRLG